MYVRTYIVHNTSITHTYKYMHAYTVHNVEVYIPYSLLITQGAIFHFFHKEKQYCEN